MMSIPPLKHYEGSYILISLSNGDVVGEIFKNSPLLKLVDFNKAKIVPIGEYLTSINGRN